MATLVSSLLPPNICLCRYSFSTAFFPITMAKRSQILWVLYSDSLRFYFHQANMSLCFGLSQMNVPLGAQFLLYYLYLSMCLHQILVTYQTIKLLHLIFSHTHNSTNSVFAEI